MAQPADAFGEAGAAAGQMTALPPNSTIGILGGGQLGRMMALAAAPLGYRCHIFTPEQDSPAAQVSAAATIADYGDTAALDRFAASVDVVTLEFENIPVATVEHLARLRPVRPGATVLRVTQDRLLEKDFARRLGYGTAPYRQVDTLADLEAALRALGTPAILKTRRMGYDGHGQVRIADASEAAAAFKRINGQPAILEGFVKFTLEASVIVARAVDGSMSPFVPVENRHANGILAKTLAPTRLPAPVADAATQLACRLAQELDVTGMLAVELFLAADGTWLVNEMAPRVHNSGHWTIEGCTTSQFEQAIRAAAGLPLGDPSAHHDAVMDNLLGNDVDQAPALLAEAGAHLHLYGKAEARAGRKMGHVTRLYPPGKRPV
jgi:5-(carboxyamino)imidazole ribonucleotide synthase